MDDKPLPPNWEKRIDSRTGWPYYVDHSSQRTQWEHPLMKVSATSAQDTNDSKGDRVNIPIAVQPDQKGTNASFQQPPQQVERERSPIAPERVAEGNNRNSPRETGSNNKTINRTATSYDRPTTLSPVEIALNTIMSIKKDAETFHVKIEAFTSFKDSKEYKYLEEMMERNLCKLDNIEANGNESIRTQRKEVVKYIQQCLDQLELKAFANETDTSENK